MSVIICGQAEVLGDACPGCGFWLHRVIQGGFPGPHGWHFCDEDCAADDHERRQARRCAEDELPPWVIADMVAMRTARGTDEPWEAAEFDQMARERGWP